MKTIRDIDFTHSTVIVRVDMNVPMNSEGEITSESRILSAVPTLNYLLAQNAKLVVITHIGRPKNHEEVLKTDKIAQRLGQILGPSIPVEKADEIVGESVAEKLKSMPYRSVLVLENIRFNKGETKGDDALSREIASLGDYFVNDAFSCCHRNHASITGIPKYLPTYAGFQMEKEINELTQLNNTPDRPFVLLQGGAKVSSKLGLLKILVHKVDKMLIGGGMSFTFLKAMGYNVGKSLLEEDKLEMAKSIIELAKETGTKLLLPRDFLVTDNIQNPSILKIVSIQDFPDDLIGVDIGPSTIAMFKQDIKNAKTVLFNGPMGIFEYRPFERGTRELYTFAGDLNDVYKVAAGGDTAAAIEHFGVDNYFSYISMGGGATLAYIEGKPLPGIQQIME